MLKTLDPNPYTTPNLGLSPQYGVPFGGCYNKYYSLLGSTLGCLILGNNHLSHFNIILLCNRSDALSSCCHEDLGSPQDFQRGRSLGLKRANDERLDTELRKFKQ